MNDIDLERYRAAWKDETRFGQQALGADEINRVLKRQSKTIIRQFRTGLLMDMVLKGIAAVALFGLLFLFRGNSTVSMMNASVLGFTLFLLFVQWKALQDVPRPAMAGESLRGCLGEMIRFYRERFLRALYVAAVSGSLVFYVGVLYYSWFKYNGIAQRWQVAFHVKDLEYCLREIDAKSLSQQQVREQRFRRIKITLMWAVWAVLGVLVLAYLLAR